MSLTIGLLLFLLLHTHSGLADPEEPPSAGQQPALITLTAEDKQILELLELLENLELLDNMDDVAALEEEQ